MDKFRDNNLRKTQTKSDVELIIKLLLLLLLMNLTDSGGQSPADYLLNALIQTSPVSTNVLIHILSYFSD